MTLYFGQTDISSYVADHGFSIARKHRSVSDDLVTIGGTLVPSPGGKDYVVLTVPIVGVTETEYSSILANVSYPKMQVRYKDPLLGLRTIWAKPYDTTTELVMDNIDGVDYWDGLVFTLEEC